MSNQNIFQKLEWDLLISKLANYCQTKDGRSRSLEIKPNLDKSQVIERWQLVEPLAELFSQGYRVPIGEIEPLHDILKAAHFGQILEGLQLRSIFSLLHAVRSVLAFAHDFASRCSTLQISKNQLISLSALYKAIEKAIDTEGQLLDTASRELADIRQQKRSLNTKIEQKLNQFLHNKTWELYLQDQFFTMRSDRYVLPIRLDGRGRVPGTIVDSSDSGQTLYIEPAAILPLNEKRQDLELSEKLEMLKILRNLSALVAKDHDSLAHNYASLIALDQQTAEAQLAVDLKAKKIHLKDEPVIKLQTARHPLVTTPNGGKAVPNDIILKEENNVLIISGPNAGGKTVVLKTVGIILLMAKSGLLIPADEESEFYLFENIYVEMGDAQSLTANLSTFSGHIQGLKPILDKARPEDLVLLDELAVGTEPQTGAAIAQAIIEDLAEKGCKSLITTHYDNLKSLAIENTKFRNASMEYSLKTLKATYQLILDIPGQSYGLELAEQFGFPQSIIKKARSLRGKSVSKLDDAVSQLMIEREQTALKAKELEKALEEALSEKARWNHEVSLLQKTKQEAAEKISAKFSKKFAEMQDSYDDISSKMSKQLKESRKNVQNPSEHVNLSEEKQLAKKNLKSFEETLSGLTKEHKAKETLPGIAATFEKLAVGGKVHIIQLKRTGTICKIGSSKHEKVEVQVELLKLKVEISNLRLLPSNEKAKVSKKKAKYKPAKINSEFASKKPKDSEVEPSPIFQSATNSIDLRGLDTDSAIESSWRFIDAAVLRGEKHILLIHGHGNNILKDSIREALKNQSPYKLSFQAGDRHIGGDGVTVVYFDD